MNDPNNNPDHFVEEVQSILACEHGTTGDMFQEYEPWIRIAYETEGQISMEDLENLCCGSDEEDPETGTNIPKALIDKYPKLTQIFEAVFDGDEPFCLKCKQNTRMNQPHLLCCKEAK